MVVNWTEKRLKRLKLLNKEGFSATIIAGKLGQAFTKGIVLRKLHLLEAARLEGAKKRSARKAAKARALSRASKDGSARHGQSRARKGRPSSPAAEAAPIRLVAPALPMPSKPSVLQGIASSMQGWALPLASRRRATRKAVLRCAVCRNDLLVRASPANGFFRDLAAGCFG